MTGVMKGHIFAALLLVSIFVPDAGAQELIGQVREEIRSRIEAAGSPDNVRLNGEPVFASELLPRFYDKRVYSPAWSDDSGPLFQARDMVRAIGSIEREGLTPSNYHLQKIIRLLNNGGANGWNPAALADLDLLLTDAFLVLSSHLLTGRVDPETFDPEWQARTREADLARVLNEALSTDTVAKTLEDLLPPHEGYCGLRDLLVDYREIVRNGGWPMVPEGPTLRKGDLNRRVEVLRQRLMVTKDLPPDAVPADRNLFDESLEQAVVRFQGRHGLETDGVVGKMTLAVLNVPAERRACQIELNMERWRWLPKDLGKRHLLVNIADFRLDVVEDGESIMTMKVVVGKPYRRTPVFSKKMTYLVLGPYWHIPRMIAVKDKLPLIRKDPAYLATERIRVIDGLGAKAREVDPATIDWASMTARKFRYRLRQDPGPLNALGRVKFMFPNRFNVYLHDTPLTDLFDKTARPFSSGCIRIDKPMELAEYLLRDDPRWTRDTLMEAIGQRADLTVELTDPIWVHLLYWTAWVDKDGSVQFREDIYKRDAPLEKALLKGPPGLWPGPE